jgi:hypothetical protein
MCPLRGERARGLAPSAGAGEASFWADPATVGWFNSSRQLHFSGSQFLLGNRLGGCQERSVTRLVESDFPTNFTTLFAVATPMLAPAADRPASLA